MNEEMSFKCISNSSLRFLVYLVRDELSLKF